MPKKTNDMPRQSLLSQNTKPSERFGAQLSTKPVSLLPLLTGVGLRGAAALMLIMPATSLSLRDGVQQLLRGFPAIEI